MEQQNYSLRAALIRWALGEGVQSPAATFPQPEPLPIEKPRETPTPDPEPVPARIPERAMTIPAGCCPRCSSPLYAPVGGGDSMKCRQCGFQSQPFQVTGVSRSQFADSEWMAAHVGKGRGVLV